MKNVQRSKCSIVLIIIKIVGLRYVLSSKEMDTCNRKRPKNKIIFCIHILKIRRVVALFQEKKSKFALQ